MLAASVDIDSLLGHVVDTLSISELLIPADFEAKTRTCDLIFHTKFGVLIALTLTVIIVCCFIVDV